MSTTALHIELIRRLHAEDEQAVTEASVGELRPISSSRTLFLRDAERNRCNSDGIPTDAPVFRIFEQIGEERYCEPCLLQGKSD